MSGSQEGMGYVKRAALVALAMATVILLCCVILLAREMIRQGQDPLELARPLPEGVEPVGAVVGTTEEAEPKGVAREVDLFFASPDGSALEREERHIEYVADTLTNCRRALEELIRGPRDGLSPVVPPTTTVRALYLLDNGELVVDFSRELLRDLEGQRSVTIEALLAQSIVNTVTQPSLRASGSVPVMRVRLLIEGSAPSKSYATHLDLSSPVSPDPTWVNASDAEPPGRA